MLPAAPAPRAATVPSGTVAVRRLLQVVLLLGGFLTLAFVLAGQAHAETPASPSTAAVRVGSAAQSLVHRVGTSAQQGVTATASRVGSAAPAVADAVTRLSGTVQQAAAPVLDGVKPVVGPITASITGGSATARPAHRGGAPHGAAPATTAARTAQATGAARTATVSCGAGAGAHPRHGSAGHRQPLPQPRPVGGAHDAPSVELDGHHGGPAAGAVRGSDALRLPFTAAASRAAHGLPVLKMPATVAVQPD